MEHPSTTAPPAIRICDSNSNSTSVTDFSFSRSRPSPSRSLSSSVSSLSSRLPMSIPGSSEPLAPPPLPPPRFIEDLAHGHDSGWKWGNSFVAGQNGNGSGNGHHFGPAAATLPPIKPSSSLMGGGGPASAPVRPPLVHRNEKYMLGEEEKSRTRSVEEHSPRRPPLASGNSLPDISSMQSTGSTGTPSLRMAYSLQGEKPLSLKAVERSSNDYDKHLLSKIGKPSSPRSSFGLSSLAERDPTPLPFHSKHKVNLSSLSIGDGPSRWSSAPSSAAISPGTRLGWSDYMSYRSPSIIDSPGLSPMEVDHNGHSQHFSFGGRRGIDETASLPSRSNKGSCDQGVMFHDSEDTDFPMDDATAYGRRRSSRERTSSYQESYSPLSRQGMKRRASSPPRISAGDGVKPLHPPSNMASGNGEFEHRRSSGFAFNGNISPNARYASHGSISSVSSSLRTGSYASSTGLSVGASSMSSYDRPSPGALSPTSDLDSSYDKGFVSPGGSHRKSSTTTPTTATGLPPYYESTEGKGPPSVRKMSNPDSAGSGTSKQPNAPRMGRLHICDCCPKKPKKFDTLEELRAHEMEKQYFCRYCNKRFKNKNEAERHQNSLHLRRHSWSCAALASYEAAFHPSASPAYQTPSGASHDTCGYCGVEFSNYPQPEWDRRIDHLTNVHKFGECNQAKKFFRADHFRQHLKHSHAGSSGKWTNILENACMREEAAPDGGLPSIGEHSVGGRDSEVKSPGGYERITAEGTTGTLASHTIDEVMEEA